MKIQFQSALPTIKQRTKQTTDNPKLLRNGQQDTVEILFGISMNKVEQDTRSFIEDHAWFMRGLTLDYSNAAWNQYSQGGDYKVNEFETNSERVVRLAKRHKDYFNNLEAFEEAERLYAQSDKISDRLLQRQLKGLRRGFKDAGKSQELLALEKHLIDEKERLNTAYNNHTLTYDGNDTSKQKLSQQLEKSNDPEESKKLWRASQTHWQAPVDSEGTKVADALTDLVKLRNNVARQNTNDEGELYTDYFDMKLDEDEVSDKMLISLLDQVEKATHKPYFKYQDITNQVTQRRYGVDADEAKKALWLGSGNKKHLLSYDLQPYLKGKNPAELMEKAANMMGDTVKSIFERSTYIRNGETRNALYYDESRDQGKVQHWFSFGIDPPDDVRTFGSMDPKHENMMDYATETLLHETLGHGLDSKHVNPELPYFLRRHHSITTESHAMLLENLMQDKEFLEKIVGIPEEELDEVYNKVKVANQIGTMSSIRWMGCLIEFERAMYKDPEQDLNKKWWQVQKKWLGTIRPKGLDNVPSYARIPHFISHPVYYKNYFLADLARAQKLAHIKAEYGSLLTEGAGEHLKEYRSYGQSYDWDDLIERMTGKSLVEGGVEALMAEFEDLDFDALQEKADALTPDDFKKE